MKPYPELTQLGRMRRYHQLARVALAAYGMPSAQLKFVRDSGNMIFRVIPDSENSSFVNNDRYFQNHLVLRLHEPDYQSNAAVQSELDWLSALCRDTNLAVPKPQTTLDGALFTEVQIPGIPQPRRCSLLRWVKGRLLKDELRPRYYRALGMTIASLHEHAANWQFPTDFTRPRYDWEGLFGDNDFINLPAGDVRKQIPDPYIKAYVSLTDQLKDVMAEFGQETDAFGLIHADISIGDNVLFGGQPMEARLIDFDDCAFGYWMFDIGVAMSELRKTDAFPPCRDALLDGYLQIRSIPKRQWDHLDLFIGAWHAFEIFWAAAGKIKFPQYRPTYDHWIARAFEDMIRGREEQGNPKTRKIV